MIRTALSFALALLALVAVSQAIPVDGPIVITAPGTYQITADIVGAGQNAAIEITASDVVLEGDGHALAGTRAREIPGVLVRNDRGTAPANVVIRNLALQEWEVGVHAIGVSHLTIENVTARKNRDHGLYLFSATNSTVRGCRVEANGGSGIVLSDVSLDNRVEANTVTGNLQNGLMLIASDRNRLTGNTVRESGTYGIDCYLTKENVIADNLFFNANNTHVEELDRNSWSLPASDGPNVAGGPRRGGNYWGEPDGGGFSDVTPDADGDGFCDSPFVIHEGNVDERPLKGTGSARPTSTAAPGFGTFAALCSLGALLIGRRR